MSYLVKLEPECQRDIEKAIVWYNESQQGLGSKFLDSMISSINILEKYPFFQVRYKNVRCLRVNKFPFMIHFTVDKVSKIIIVRAILHTSQNPDHWK